MVSNTKPGAINLITNHFKLRVKNYGTVAMYSIDFGQNIDRADVYAMKEAVKNCQRVLEKNIGLCMYFNGHVFSMTGMLG